MRRGGGGRPRNHGELHVHLQLLYTIVVSWCLHDGLRPREHRQGLPGGSNEASVHVLEGVSVQGDLESAYGRIAASFAHMVWTGYAACGLAKWQFLPEGDPARPRSRCSAAMAMALWPSGVQYLLPPIFLHGLYNWCSTLQRCEAYEEVYQGQLYKSDGCYLPPMWRMVFKAAHTAARRD